MAFREAELGATISALARDMSIRLADVADPDPPPDTCAIDFLAALEGEASPRDVRLYAFIRARTGHQAGGLAARL